jgi:hypothetical protein
MRKKLSTRLFADISPQAEAKLIELLRQKSSLEAATEITLLAIESHFRLPRFWL